MNGMIIINKPLGFTSQDVVSKVKKILNIKKAGHIGTLDPMATGVLPILLGSYTKLTKYLIEHDKTYRATVKLGKKTDTGDSEGNIIEEEKVDISMLHHEKVKNVLDSFQGIQKQKPPMYAAIKIQGKKLYEYARLGEQILVPEREIQIYEIKLMDICSELNEISFQVNCSKGTYIRVLCEDIAKRLGTIGYMQSLCRIAVDKLILENAITIEMLEKNKYNEQYLQENVLTMQEIFHNLLQITLNEKQERLFLNGGLLSFQLNDGLYHIYNAKQEYLGIGKITEKLLKRDVLIV